MVLLSCRWLGVALVGCRWLEVVLVGSGAGDFGRSW